MVVSTECIVLRLIDYGESSRIVTLLTRSHGKLAVIARGAKKPKSKLGGIMNLGGLLDITFYLKDSRGVQNLKEVSTKTGTNKIRYTFPKLALLMPLLEISNQVLQDHEENEAYFKFLWDFICWLEQTDQEAGTLFPYLQTRIAELMGVGLQSDEIKDEKSCYLNIISGTVSDRADDGLSFLLTSDQQWYLTQALQGRSGRLLKKELPVQELKSLIYHLDVYLKHHFEGLRDRKSDAILDQIL